jgi:hypothetical protein
MDDEVGTAKREGRSRVRGKDASPRFALLGSLSLDGAGEKSHGLQSVALRHVRADFVAPSETFGSKRGCVSFQDPFDALVEVGLLVLLTFGS